MTCYMKSGVYIGRKIIRILRSPLTKEIILRSISIIIKHRL